MPAASSSFWKGLCWEVDELKKMHLSFWAVLICLYVFYSSARGTVKTCWWNELEFRGGRARIGVWSWPPSPSSSFAAAPELYKNPISASQQGNRSDVFQQSNLGEKNKIKLLVWFDTRTMKNQKDGNGKEQTVKASSNTNTPAAGLRHGSNVFTLPSLEQSE